MPFDFSPFQQKMNNSLEHFRGEIGGLRTGKATVQLLDPVTVEVYGSRMKIVELATVTAPDSTLLVVSPWDKGILSNIEKAIASADLNLNPVVDGQIIRVPVPPLTEERRKEMVKILHQKAEAGRVMLRNIRAETKRDIEQQKGEAGVSEDDIETDTEQLDKSTQAFIEQLDKLIDQKEKDLLTV